MTDRLLVLVHVAAACLFLGNIATGLFWVMRAQRSRSTHVLGHTFASLNGVDAWITTPAVLVLTLTGIAAAVRMGFPLLGTGWILWSVVAFALSGIVFATRVLPLQKRIARALGDAVRAGATLEPTALTARWSRWAHLSLALAVAALVLMVLKPALPALGR